MNCSMCRYSIQILLPFDIVGVAYVVSLTVFFGVVKNHNSRNEVDYFTSW